MYKELVSYWLDGQKKWDKYKDDVQFYATGIRNYFLKQLNIDDANYLKLFNPKDTDSKIIEEKLYRLEEIIDFAEDGWAKIGIRLLLERNRDSFPKVQYIFSIAIKIIDKQWIVKLYDSSKQHSFVVYDRNDPNDYNGLWKEFINIFRERTFNDLENWLDCKERARIGFLQDLSSQQLN